ncbi:MAG: hypothetical protein ACK4NS_13405, partial [Saprospiraceae bacterium]
MIGQEIHASSKALAESKIHGDKACSRQTKRRFLALKVARAFQTANLVYLFDFDTLTFLFLAKTAQKSKFWL